MLDRVKLSAAIALILSTVATGAAARADLVYDAVADFSVASNQNVNGVWSYGGGVGSAFSLLTTSNTQEFGIDGVWSWRGGTPGAGGFYPIIMANKTGGPITAPELPIFPTDLLGLHPSPAGIDEEATLRWIAPNAGAFLFDGRFQGLQSDNGTVPTTDVRVVLNGSEILFSGSINSVGVPLAFAISRNLAAGDILDFAIGDGGNGFAKDGTGLAVVVTQAVPEPSSIMLIATGLLGVGVRVGRRRPA